MATSNPSPSPSEKRYLAARSMCTKLRLQHVRGTACMEKNHDVVDLMTSSTAPSYAVVEKSQDDLNHADASSSKVSSTHHKNTSKATDVTAILHSRSSHRSKSRTASPRTKTHDKSRCCSLSPSRTPSCPKPQSRSRSRPSSSASFDHSDDKSSVRPRCSRSQPRSSSKTAVNSTRVRRSLSPKFGSRNTCRPSSEGRLRSIPCGKETHCISKSTSTSPR